MTRLGPYKKLGTTWWFELFDFALQKVDSEIDLEEQAVAIKNIEKALLNELDRFESLYSRFLSGSLVTQCNEKKELDNPSAEFVNLLQIGLDAYQYTRGVFNITAGGVLESQGYDADYSFQVNDGIGNRESGRRGELSDPTAGISILRSVSDNKTDTVVRLDEEISIDFGGYGKGYVIDLLAKILVQNSQEYFLINGGGDMFGTSNHGKAIEIILQDPVDRKKAIGKLHIQNEAFAASSPHVRAWKDGESRYTHLVSESMEEKKSVFVLAPTALEADIWATTLAIDPYQKTPQNVTSMVI